MEAEGQQTKDRIPGEVDYLHGGPRMALWRCTSTHYHSTTALNKSQMHIICAFSDDNLPVLLFVSTNTRGYSMCRQTFIYSPTVIHYKLVKSQYIKKHSCSNSFPNKDKVEPTGMAFQTLNCFFSAARCSVVCIPCESGSLCSNTACT